MRTMDASRIFMSELCCAYGNARESAMINKSLYGSCEQWVILSCITQCSNPHLICRNINASIYMFSSYASKYWVRESYRT